jgi:allantoicase
MSDQDINASAFWGTVDLASADIGGEALLCSDDFFAGMDNLLKPGPAVFLPDEYTERGKWMDGWESRRKRTPGHDWCLIRLGVPGRIRGVDIDTAHFLGNHPPFASLEACFVPGASPEQLRDEVTWTPILQQIGLRRGSQNLAAVASDSVWTHVRLNIFPAGGVARLRVYGDPDPASVPALPLDLGGNPAQVDLAALARGGCALACSDMFFSSMNNLLLPSRATNMGQGWETRRSRPPGKDWVIVRLGQAGLLETVEIDTNHFRGNYPDRCALDGIYWPEAPPHALTRSGDWTEIISSTKLRAHEQQLLPVAEAGPWTHVRLRIAPDGGVSRMRVFGTPSATRPAASDSLVSALNDLSDAAALDRFGRCCGSTRWAAAMVSARPFSSRAHLVGMAEQVWWGLGDGDWLEAAAHHPMIGADVASLREKFAATADLAEGEQAGVAGATEETLKALAQANADYVERFGHVFLICATGKSAEAMLTALQERIDNEPPAELRIAAGEQVKITRIRLLRG